MMVILDENGRKLAEEKFTIPLVCPEYCKDIQGCHQAEVIILILNKP